MQRAFRSLLQFAHLKAEDAKASQAVAAFYLHKHESSNFGTGCGPICFRPLLLPAVSVRDSSLKFNKRVVF